MKRIFIFFNVVASLVLLMLLMGCADRGTAGSVRLDKVISQSMPASFDEQSSMVLRCSSVLEDSSGITITTSKSKDLCATQLLFVQPLDNQNVSLICAVPVAGKEYEYDVSQAKYYWVTAQSASAALERFGIPYSDWQMGAVSGSEKFPCCE